MKLNITIFLLTLCTIGFSQVTVIQNQNVGIGTELPTSKLQIVEDSNEPALEITKKLYSEANIRCTSIQPDRSYSQISVDGHQNQAVYIELDKLGLSPHDQFRIDKNGGTNLYYINNLDEHEWSAGGVRRMFLDRFGHLDLRGRMTQQINGTGVVALGASAGGVNLTGVHNIFQGYYAGNATTTGAYNIFLGYHAGLKNKTGSNNIHIGQKAGRQSEAKAKNILIGEEAGESNSGNTNVIIGYKSGSSNSGAENVILGVEAGTNNAGQYNFISGYHAGQSNTGNYNNFIGYYAGNDNTSGASNIFLGSSSGRNNTTGQDNIFLGSDAGFENSLGSYNMNLGTKSGRTNFNGSRNVNIGYQSGFENINGSNNVNIGFQAGYNNTASERLHIGNSASNTLIYGEFDNEIVEINGSLKVNDILNLKATGTEPGIANSQEGDIYMDNGNNTASGTPQLRYFNGTIWLDL